MCPQIGPPIQKGAPRWFSKWTGKSKLTRGSQGLNTILHFVICPGFQSICVLKSSHQLAPGLQGPPHLQRGRGLLHHGEADLWRELLDVRPHELHGTELRPEVVQVLPNGDPQNTQRKFRLAETRLVVIEPATATNSLRIGLWDPQQNNVQTVSQNDAFIHILIVLI